MKLKDISEQETHTLHTSLSLLLELNAMERQEEYVRDWRKYVNLVAMLEMSMVVIVEKYRAGKLEGFSAEEVRHLVVALFSDSPFRTQNLQKIVS